MTLCRTSPLWSGNPGFPVTGQHPAQGKSKMAEFGVADLCILVLDSQERARESLVRILTALGVNVVVEAESASVGLEKIDSSIFNFDVIIADLQMAEGDGVEILRHLEERNSHAGIIITGGGERRTLRAGADLARARGLRVLGTIEKPVTTSTVSEMLSRLAFSKTETDPKYDIVIEADDIARAVEENELLVYYQPKMAIPTREIVGAEALVRWLHPDHGLLPPDVFIPRAVEAGLIEPLTHLVLGKAFEQAGTWAAAGRPVPLAVNIAPESLTNLDLPNIVLNEARRHGVEPSSLTVEITESGVVKDMAAALDVLTRLRLKGVGVAIDDYGTGFATVSQLEALPFDEVKLDRTFVTGASRAPRLRKILESSISLAQDLELKTIAEGVETIDDWRLLEELGCDAAQGFFFAMPMPGADLPIWMVAQGD